MPPDARRAAIVAAVLPLLEEHGPDVSTRRLAAAAGVAEGTIFRAFGNKDALVQAVMQTVFDAGPLLALLRDIDPGLPLRERMIAGVEISQRRLRAVFKLMFAMRLQRPPQLKGADPEDAARRKADAEEVDRIFADLLRPDADQLRFTPEEVVHRLRLLTFSATHPLISDGRPMTAEEIVDFTLDGVRHHEPGDH
ncbi:transcriptional regulator, TetR family [Kribbella flavida DSM 17836]|uniref:Transcriptional regulator, TetR family n=2 Tax=Kribbella flavida TaxID=182640 RepID=D2PMW8_KRIFD|nr:transcriptional regulator, TetR family [Kribbella flavida DSM 17836]